MQYKIPLQIENEDTIVLGLSLRQLGIMMAFGGVAYSLFKFLEPQIGNIALVPSGIIAIVWVMIALLRVSEMTFLPFILNFLRMSLNGKIRHWSQGTDSYSEFEIGYIKPENVETKPTSNKQSFDAFKNSNENFSEQLQNL